MSRRRSLRSAGGTGCLSGEQRSEHATAFLPECSFSVRPGIRAIPLPARVSAPLLRRSCRFPLTRAQQSALHRVDAYSGGRFACEGRTSCSHSGTRATPHARMSRRSLVVSLCRPPTGTRSSSRRGGAGARCRTRAERRHSAPGCRAREPFSCAGSVNPAPRQLRRMWPCRSGSDGQVLVASQYLRRLSLVS